MIKLEELIHLNDRNIILKLKEKIDELADELQKEIKIMEVCGTHTVSIRRNGIHSLLPTNVKMISGPGCPVCVTPASYIDNAIQLVEEKRAIVVTFGDMLKVPGTKGYSLSRFMGSGWVRVIYSPAEMLEIRKDTSKPVVFLGIGFETTVPTIASTFLRGVENQLEDMYLYTSFKTVPPALEALLADTESEIDAFLLPGHVSVILGMEPYRKVLERKNGIPGVIGGFEPVDIMLAIYKILKQLAEGRREVENAYPRAVRGTGNPKARAVIEKLLEPGDELWRGLGKLPASGLRIRREYENIDAVVKFGLSEEYNYEPAGCLCAEVIQGKVAPNQCPHFAKDCIPEEPIGPCMVSSEGACAAYYRYGDIG